MAFSWAWWGVAIAGGQEWTRFPTILLYVVGGSGPSLVAVLLIYRHGPEPPAGFWRRVVDPRRIPPAWYAAILVVAFAPGLVARLWPAGNGAAGTGEEAAMAVMIPVAVLAGLAEELGWRGYALDRLLTVGSALTAGLVVGAVWTVWHLPFYFIEGTIQSDAGLWSADFWFDMAGRIPLAVLFAWVYVNTAHSILGAVLLHAADNLASVILSPEGAQLVVRLAAVTGLAVFVVARWGPRRLTHSRLSPSC